MLCQGKPVSRTSMRTVEVQGMEVCPVYFEYPRRKGNQYAYATEFLPRSENGDHRASRLANPDSLSAS